MKASWRLSFAALAWLSLGASCGETKIEAVRRVTPEGQSMRERSSRIARLLPSRPARSGSRSSSMSPPLVIDFRREEFSAEVLMAEQLESPEAEAQFDLMLSHDLLHCLLWTGPKNPLERSVWDDAADGLAARCQRAFRIPWLVVVRMERVQLPTEIEFSAFVVDVAREEIAYELALSLRGPSGVRVTSELHSSAYVASRCALAQRLSELPGARVDLRSRSGLFDGGEPCRNAFAVFRPREPLGIAL